MRAHTIHGELWNAMTAGEDNREQLDRLSALLRRIMREELTERQRDAFLMHVGQGMRQKEIAALWGVRPSVVCRHIQRAEARLRHWTEKLADIAGRGYGED